MPVRLRYTDAMPDCLLRVADRVLPAMLRGGALIAVALLAGCQLMPFERDAADDDSQGKAGRGSDEAPPPQTDSVGQALVHLQNGEIEPAESILERLLEANPDSSIAQLLLAQIQQPPESFLVGEETMEIEVEPGDTLSRIAGRYLGNELLFFALARLNDIEQPRLLRPGRRLKVPVPEASAQTEAAPPEEDEQAPPQEPQPPGVGPTARALVEKGRPAPAYALLLSTARAGKLEPAAAELLGETAVRLSQTAIESGDLDRARKYLDQAAPWLEQARTSAAFARQVETIAAADRLIRARESLDNGDHDAAYESWMAARDQLDRQQSVPALDVESLRAELSEHFHSRALAAWRDQEIERAVRLWERVLAVDPDFEPATVYLERARRARRRLESLDGPD